MNHTSPTDAPPRRRKGDPIGPYQFMMKAEYTHKGKYKDQHQVPSQASPCGSFQSAVSKDSGSFQSAVSKDSAVEEGDGSQSDASKGFAVAEGGGPQSAQCNALTVRHQERLAAQVEAARRQVEARRMLACQVAAQARPAEQVTQSARTQKEKRVSWGEEVAEGAPSHPAPPVDVEKSEENKDDRARHLSEQRSAVAEGDSWSWASGDAGWTSWGGKTWRGGGQTNEWESMGWIKY